MTFMHTFERTECTPTSCPPNSTCVDLNPGFGCKCDEGFVKNTFGDCVDIDECSGASSNTCGKNATCRNANGTHHCFCDATKCDFYAECQRDAAKNFECNCLEGFVTRSGVCFQDDVRVKDSVFASIQIESSIVGGEKIVKRVIQEELKKVYGDAIDSVDVYRVR